jgi:hypothetical protein
VTWSAIRDLGATFAIQNAQFPTVIAGDNDRAACAFLGTTTGGDDQRSTFTGVWYLYVAFTYDGGASWTTVNATPNDPVQRGCIWLGGGSNKCRNLLDFMDIAIGPDGRVYVGFADGCIGACVSGGSNSYTALATIARQSAGNTLFAAFDPTPSATPAATATPTVTAAPTATRTSRRRPTPMPRRRPTSRALLPRRQRVRPHERPRQRPRRRLRRERGSQGTST